MKRKICWKKVILKWIDLVQLLWLSLWMRILRLHGRLELVGTSKALIMAKKSWIMGLMSSKAIIGLEWQWFVIRKNMRIFMLGMGWKREQRLFSRVSLERLMMILLRELRCMSLIQKIHQRNRRMRKEKKKKGKKEMSRRYRLRNLSQMSIDANYFI